MSNRRVPVTDHALLRVIERVYGVDIEAVRAGVADTPGLAAAVAAGAIRFSVGGFCYMLDEGRVVTVVPGGGGVATLLRGFDKKGTTKSAPKRRNYQGGSHGFRSPRPVVESVADEDGID